MPKKLLKSTQKELEKLMDKEGVPFIGEVLVELEDLLTKSACDIHQNPRILQARKVIEDLFKYSLEKYIDDESREQRKNYCNTYFGILIEHGLPPLNITEQKPQVRHYWTKGLQYEVNDND